MFACFLSFVRYKYVESLFIPNLCRHFAQEVIQLMEVGVINNTIQNNPFCTRSIINFQFCLLKVESFGSPD